MTKYTVKCGICGKCHNLNDYCNGRPRVPEGRQIAMLQSEIEDLRQEIEDVRIGAFIRGLKEYAHWNDGVQYVGTAGRTLREAIDIATKEK